MRKIFLLFFFIIFSGSVQAQITTEHEIDAFSQKSNSSEAKKEMIEKATKSVAKEYIIEMVGESKYRKNRLLIENKLIRDSGKFIPLIRTGDIRATGQGYAMKINLTLSNENLRAVLLEQGLLYSTEGAPIIYPFIQVADRIHGLNYRWWVAPATRDQSFISEKAHSVERALFEAFSRKGFYLAQPVESQAIEILPKAFRRDLRLEDYRFLNEYLKMQIYVAGKLSIERHPLSQERRIIRIDWQAIYNNNGRVVAEIHREFETDSGPFDLTINKKLDGWLSEVADLLSVQVLEAWQKGTFGASLYRLVLQGPIEYQELESFKRKVRSKAKYVKGLKERFFRSGQVTLEADFTGGVSQLAEIITSTEVEGIQFQIAEIGPSQAVVNVLRGP